jgi:membrane fusion protein
LAFTIVTILFLLLSEYTRKETVKGYLVPDKGLIKVYSSRSGIVEKLYVKEGDVITENMALALVRIPQSMASGEELGENLIGELNKQLTLLLSDEEQNRKLQNKEHHQLTSRLDVLKQSLAVVDKQRTLHGEKLALYKKQAEHHKKLYQQRFISDQDYNKQQEIELTSRQEQEALAITALELQNEINQLEYELETLPYRYSLKAAELARRKSDIQNKLSETKNNSSYIIRAAQSGKVTAIQVVEGHSINSSYPLMGIIPEGAVLVAELLLPTRSAGFVQQGDTAKLRFDAFPYQRFGLMTSLVSEVDQALLIPGEANLPFELSEPVYRIRSLLDRQYIEGYGRKFSLKSGMMIEADIILDRQSLLHWILDPIYSLRERIQQ